MECKAIGNKRWRSEGSRTAPPSEICRNPGALASLVAAILRSVVACKSEKEWHARDKGSSTTGDDTRMSGSIAMLIQCTMEEVRRRFSLPDDS